MKVSLIFLLAICLITSKAYCQMHIDSLNGDIIQKGGTKNVYKKTVVIHKNDKPKNADKILLVNKYLDTTKNILIKFGSNTAGVSMARLRRGFLLPIGGLSYYPTKDRHYDTTFKIKCIKNQITISTILFDIDGKFIARIKDNQLIASPKNYIIYAYDKFIELYNDYHIPVLQLDLDKKSNSITLSGMFYTSAYCVVISPKGFLAFPYNKPYHLLEQQQKDSILFICNERAERLLKP